MRDPLTPYRRCEMLARASDLVAERQDERRAHPSRVTSADA